MMIEVKNLSFSYGKRKQKVFNDFSLTLDKGSVYGLLVRMVPVNLLCSI